MASLNGRDLFKDKTMFESPVVKDCIKQYSRPSPHLLSAPMLAIHGTTGPFPASITVNDYNLMCNAKPDKPLNLQQYNRMSCSETLEAVKGVNF